MAGLQLQMNWQPNLLKKRKNGPPLGFKNLGNTCYLNAVLQCLTYTPPLANFCLKFQHSAFCDSAGQQEKKSDCPFCLLEKRIVRSLSIDLTLDTPGKIIGGLKIFAEHFRLGRQEDAHEFLRYVIDACHTACLRLKKLQQQQQQQQKRKFVSNGGGDSFGGSTVVKEIFGGALQSQVKCLTCGNESNKVDEIMDISIDVLNSSSLKEAFQKFFQPEILDGNNKYKCDNCKKLVAARKQMSILQAPNILVIQLKRFEGIFGGKIDKAIAFEEVLVLSSFMCKASQDPDPEYNLFATIVHSGFSPDSGHYYAYIKDAIGRWYCCNDSYVSLSTLQEVFSEKVYILFFSRTKQRPVLPNKHFTTNGIKASSNGNRSDKSEVLKSDHLVKSTDLQQCVNHQSQKDDSAALSKSKIPSSPQKKLSTSGNFGTRKFPNMKIIVHGKENNGDVKVSNSKKTSEEKRSTSSNGFSQDKPVDTVKKVESKTFSVVNGNGEIQKSTPDFIANGCESNCTRNGYGMTMRKGPEYKEVRNGDVKIHPDMSNSKRKVPAEQQSCILFGEDSQSRAKCEMLKESLEKEASSFLKKCGWSDEVHSFMHAKKLRAREAGNGASDIDDLKRTLVADAKSAFISRIPESLKANLIERLREFS